MCKQRWRPYIKNSPTRFLSKYGAELGQTIIEKNIEAVSTASLYTGKWVAMIGGEVFTSPFNGIIIPAAFDDPYIAQKWLLATLPDLDLFQPERIEHTGSRIAYRVYSPLTREITVAELVAISAENEQALRQKYLSAVRSRQPHN